MIAGKDARETGNVMSQEGFNPGLRLKIAGQAAAPVAALRPEGLDTALTRALGKAAAPFEGLGLEASVDPPQWDIRPPDIAGALPEAGLLVMLDAGDAARALCLMDPGLVDALIEVQTTGAVAQGQGAVRPPTRIDAALTRDFLGLFLGALAGELAGKAGVDWPPGLSYGTHLSDRRQLELLLPDRPYHLFSASLDLGAGAKAGRLVLAVPVTGTAQVDGGGGTGAPDPGDWAARWQQAIRAAPLTLEAVLACRTLPLSRIEALQPGDVLPLDREDLAATALCDAGGRVIFRARLGRSAGHRAVRLTAGRGLAPAKAAPPAPAAPTDPPSSAASGKSTASDTADGAPAA